MGEGDLLFVRVGHRRRRTGLGAWPTAQSRAALHPSALEFLADRRVAVLGGDGNNGTAPSSTEGVDFPVHVLAIRTMGLHLLDHLSGDPSVRGRLVERQVQEPDAGARPAELVPHAIVDEAVKALPATR
ncbi:hypothetical protein [Streptomyces sp. NBC_00354]|uniref:hypothetical protein n=1 Tax=Streptomyces sp. NBC_00354 TaxID=2975723 RepID=UPI003FA7D920